MSALAPFALLTAAPGRDSEADALDLLADCAHRLQRPDLHLPIRKGNDRDHVRVVAKPEHQRDVQQAQRFTADRNHGARQLGGLYVSRADHVHTRCCNFIFLFGF